MTTGQFGCAAVDGPSSSIAASAPAPRAYDPDLAAELLALAADDQRFERLVVDQDPAIREPGFFDQKARRQRERTARCREILAAHGYPAADLVGPEAASAFWVLVQHADADPDFQVEVLVAMEPFVARGLADGTEFAYLTDRVGINTRGRQWYGTQVAYDNTAARPYPKPLDQPEAVDDRREAVGLLPLWASLNDVAEGHYRMNQAGFEAAGIMSPWRYPDGFRDW